MNNNLKTLILIILTVFVGSMLYFFVRSSDTPQVSTTNATLTNSVATPLELGQDFTLPTIPSGWEVESQRAKMINTVKFGSAATITNLIPVDRPDDEVYGSSISISTFTIDPRLDATGVVNLINDEEIADTISADKEPCYALAETTISADEYTVYAYTTDTIDYETCVMSVSEPAVSASIVAKQIDGDRAVTLNLVTVDAVQYAQYEPVFMDMAEAIIM